MIVTRTNHSSINIILRTVYLKITINFHTRYLKATVRIILCQLNTISGINLCSNAPPSTTAQTYFACSHWPANCSHQADSINGNQQRYSHSRPCILSTDCDTPYQLLPAKGRFDRANFSVYTRPKAQSHAPPPHTAERLLSASKWPSPLLLYSPTWCQYKVPHSVRQDW